MKKKNVILLDEYDRYVFDKHFDESFQKIKEVCDIHDINSDVSKIVAKDNHPQSGIIYTPSEFENKYYELPDLMFKSIEDEISLLTLYGRYFNIKSIDVNFNDKKESTLLRIAKDTMDGFADAFSFNASTQSKYSSVESFKKSLEEKYVNSGDKRYTIEEARLKLEEDKIDYEQHKYLKRFMHESRLGKLRLSFEYNKSIIDSTTNSLKASNFNIPILEGLKKQIEIISNKSTSQIINSAQSIEINIEYFD